VHFALPHNYYDGDQPHSTTSPGRTDAERPAWFRAFLTDRATRKPSPHTLQAYRQDFDAIARLVAADPQHISALTPRSITKDSMRLAFAAYAESHEAASIRRC
jgi:integrase/recombinase XerC